MEYLQSRLLLIATAATFASGVVQADPTWNISSNSAASGCTASTAQIKCSTDGVDLTAKAYYSDTRTGKFMAAQTVRATNDYVGIRSYDGATAESTNSPHHAIDNISSSGANYAELLHLNFSAAVDLTSIVATWTGKDYGSGYNGDFMVFRWDGVDSNGIGTTPDILGFTAAGVQAANSGWSLVASKDFSANKTQGIDSDKYSSHWLVTTAFGGTNDAFKLKTFSATVCAYTVKNGACKPPETPPNGQTPEPGTLALAALGALGVMRMRRKPA